MAPLALPTIQTNPQDSTPSWEDLRKQFQAIEKKIGAAAKQPILSAGMAKSSKIGKDVDQSKLFNLHESFVTFMQKNIQDFINKTIKTVISLSQPLMKEETDKPSVEEQREARLIQEDYQTQQIQELKNITELLEKILKAGGMGGKGDEEGGWLDTIADFAQIASFLRGGKLGRLGRVAKVAKAGRLGALAQASNRGRAVTTAARISDKAVKTTKAATTATKNIARSAVTKGKSIVGLGAKAGTMAAGTAAAAGVVPEIAGAAKGADVAVDTATGVTGVAKGADAASDIATGVTGVAKGADAASDIATGVAKGADVAVDTATGVTGVAKGADAASDIATGVTGVAKGADVAADGAKLATGGIKAGLRGIGRFLGPIGLLLDAGFGGYAIYEFMNLLDKKETGEVDNQEFEEQGKSLWVDIVRSLGYPAIGAIIGSAFPIVGTLAGGVVGSTVGALDWGAEWLTGWSPAKSLGELIFETAYMGDDSEKAKIQEAIDKQNELNEQAKQGGTTPETAPSPGTGTGTGDPVKEILGDITPPTPPQGLELPQTGASASPQAAPISSIADITGSQGMGASSGESSTTVSSSPSAIGKAKITPEGGKTIKGAVLTAMNQVASGEKLEQQTMNTYTPQFVSGGSSQSPQIINNYYNTTNVAGGGGGDAIEDSSPVGQPSESIMNMMLSADAHGARMGINS